jgi:zinc D-Ala-D-Ala dipeptidase
MSIGVCVRRGDYPKVRIFKQALLIVCALVELSPSCWAIESNELVDVASLTPSIRLDIRYATSNNFTGKAVYPVARCMLRKEMAERLVRVQQKLEHKNMGLKIFDCYRPFSIQQVFWKLVPDGRYVAEPIVKGGVPIAGSRHNRGAAVDVSLVDHQGVPLEMPTDFDDFSEKAHRNYAGSSSIAKTHLRLLEQAMSEEHFQGIATEWWHFDAEGWSKYSLLDIPF